MSARNGYAALVKQRADGATKRRPLDDYETPADKTAYLAAAIHMSGSILEPACGSGRMVRALRDAFPKCTVAGSDIKHGRDFLARSRPWHGHVVTNPPYRSGLAERFARHALGLASGRVCMLFQSGFLFTTTRAAGLFAEFKPDFLLIVPERIYFITDGAPITSQFFNHVWLCWPSRRTREHPDAYDTKTIWCAPDAGF